MKFMMHPTDEIQRLEEFMKQYGLEFHEEDRDKYEVLKCWKITQGYRSRNEDLTEKNDYMVACIMLVKRSGEYVIEGIAVEPVIRKSGIGTVLVKKAISYVRDLGGKRIYLVAKVPEFFKTMGFKVIDRTEAPVISGCMTCEQFKTECFPEVMVLEL